MVAGRGVGVVLDLVAGHLHEGLLEGGLLRRELMQADREVASLVADLRGEVSASQTAGRRWTMRDVLVAGQMAITVLLLVIAALLTRSFIAAQGTNSGFAVNRLAIVSIDTGTLGLNADQSQRFYDTALARVSAIPGVESAALATRVPMQLNANTWEIWVPGRHQPGEHGDTVEVTTVSPEYFKTMGVGIVEGRAFTTADRPETPRVAIVNETLARSIWPGQSAIGKIFRTRAGVGPPFAIVGVTADHKVRTLSETPTPFLHIAFTQRPSGYSAIVARTRGDAPALLRDMRNELLSIDPNLVFVENQTMEMQVDATLFPMRASAWLVSGVGLVAMLLAAIGIYGVIAYSVARRTKEIGLRMALGAAPSRVRLMVLRQVGVMVVIGGAIGLTFAVGLGWFAQSLLYELKGTDPLVLVAAAVSLSLVGLAAGFVPAHRASQVDPMSALRYE